MTVDSASRPVYANLSPGDPAPWFKQRSTSNANYVFDTAAGRYIVLCFFGSSADPKGEEAVRAALAGRRYFDDERICFFGVSTDPADEADERVRESMPGIRYFWDFDCVVSRMYGSAPLDQDPGAPIRFRRFWMVLDAALRVAATFALGETEALFGFLAHLPMPGHLGAIETPAPVIVLPNVFEPEFCRHLIEAYDRAGGHDSGFMRDVNGHTVLIQDRRHKVRQDFVVADQAMIEPIQKRILRRIVPEIKKVHQFEVTRMERYLVACYAASEGGHFRAHRDNTTAGTAHRRFAVSINLNDDFDGGCLSFPEYGSRSYKAPPGAAVVFSCSLLHAVSRVTTGRRYAFLPFLYDEAAAKIRQANAGKIVLPN